MTDGAIVECVYIYVCLYVCVCVLHYRHMARSMGPSLCLYVRVCICICVCHIATYVGMTHDATNRIIVVCVCV